MVYVSIRTYMNIFIFSYILIILLMTIFRLLLFSGILFDYYFWYFKHL